MGLAVGIDLGTTNCAVAHLDEYGRPVTIPSAEGENITPSVVCFRNGEVIVGREAKELQGAGAPQVAAFFKRQMGVRDYVFYAEGKDHTAVDLSACVLRKLKRDAEAHLGQEVTGAVITVPAYFRNPQREATIAAGRLAGLNVLQTINEPTAAAMAYGLRDIQGEKTLLVYDLGGGTFDVTLLRITPAEIQILSSEGDHELGGKDWDDRLVEFAANRFQSEFNVDPYEDIEAISDLLVRAEDAKKKLTTSMSTTIAFSQGASRGRYEISREFFNELTDDLMERSRSLCFKVLEQRNIQPAALDGVLLVGGSTRMAVVRDFVERIFGKPPLAGVNVDEAVALGAAIATADHAARDSKSSTPRFSLGGRKTIDVTNHSLGMIAVNETRSKYINGIVLPKDRSIPCVESRPFQVPPRRSGKAQVDIYMTQGETESPEDVAYLGKYVVHDIPADAHGISVLDVEYSYDLSGTVQVSARARATGQALSVAVEPLPPDVPERFLKSPQEEVTVEPATVYLVFDLSGSMSGAPLHEAKKAAHKFLENIDLANCALGIMAVADSVGVTQEACHNGKSVAAAIERLRIGDVGGGNSAHPFDEIHAQLNQKDGRRIAVVLADGVWSHQDLAIRQARRCHAAEIEVVAIGFGSADPTFLKAIASSDDASFFVNLNQIVEKFSTIAQVFTESGSGSTMLGGAASTLPGEKKSFMSRLKGR